MNIKIWNIFILIPFCSQLPGQEQNDTTIYAIPEIFSEFKYENDTSTKTSLENYVSKNFKMPLSLIDNGYTGSIIIKAIIEKYGTINNVSIFRGMGDKLDDYLLDFVKNMPKWSPGMIKDENVRTEVIFPIKVKWL